MSACLVPKMGISCAHCMRSRLIFLSGIPVGAIDGKRATLRVAGHEQI